MFRTFLTACLGFIAGAVITYLVVVVGTTVAWDILDVHDQDGGGAMALGLVIGPFIALFGGIAGAFLLPAWAARRRRNTPPQTDEQRARDTCRFFIIGGAVIGGIVGHQAAQFGFWLIGSISYDSYWKVWAIAWLPTLITALGAIAGGLCVRHMMRPL